MSHLVPLPLPCPVQLGTVKADASGSQLHQFVREGSHTKVKKILMKGVAVDTINSLGQTPLFIAALLDLVKVVDVLLMFGADPNHRCDDRSTPVHAAAFSCNQWILSKLLDAGGDLRLNDKDGRLPQVWAQSAGKERSVRILEFMQRCTSHMQEITQQVSYSISHQIGSSSESLIRNPSILNKITYRIKDGEFLSNPKARSISSQTVQCFGFGKFCVLGSTQLAYLASIPLVSEKSLVQPDDEPTFSYTTGPYTTMTNLTWNGIRVTVKQMNRPTHLNCSKRLSADLLITEQEYSSHLRHPSLLLLMAVCQLSELDQIRLVYERVNLGSLYGVLHERRSEFPVLRMEMIVQMLLQITDALLYLHSWGYIHRTVTSHAVQLVLPGIAKLSNLEFMVKSVDGGIYNNLSQFPIPSQFYNWLAPEVIRGRTATVKSDVYSFCTLVQELFTDLVPWEDLDGFAVKELLAAGRCLTVDDQIPKPYYDIVRMGIQVKPQNRTTNLQDIRFVLRNDFKDLISNKKKHTSEKDQSDLCLHDDVNMFETNGVDHRREQEQLQKENAGKGKQPECLEQAQLTSDNDEYSYYNLGHRTSFSPKKCGADNKIRHLNSEPSQQITVLYDCWKTEHNQFEDKAESRAHHGVYIEDKAGNDSNPWKKIEQHYDSESSEPSEKHYSDVLGHLRELDLALDEEMFATSDEEGASIISLKTGREYTSDEGDEQSDRTTTLSQDWSGVKGLESDQENHGRVCQRTLTSSTMEEEDIATSISVQDSISSCKINIQTSKHLMQQAFSALDRTMRSYNSEIGTIQKSKKENQISDQIEKTPCTNLLGYDEVDYPRQNAKGNKQIKSSNEGHLVIPIAVAPPACYQLPVSGVEKIHEANPAGHFQPTFEFLGHTEDERTAGAKGCSSDVLKTSETFADGTQTICSLKKQENVERVDYKFTHDKSVKSMPGHKNKPTMKCKKKMNVLAQVHEHENIPVRKGRISMRIPPHGDQQGSRKQCMYLSSNRKIHITQSCNIVAEGVKVRQKKNPEGYHFTNMEKPQDQNCGRPTKGESVQASVSTNWTSDMTDMIEKMTSGCLPVGQGESKQQNNPRTKHVDEEELFRQFAKQPRRSMKQPHPSNRQFVHSVDHQQMKYNPYYTPEEAHIESDNSLEMEKSLQSVTGQRVYFDSYQSGGSEEEREITNMDKTFTTGRKQNEAQKENVQYFSPSDSSFNKSDEFFTPNSELLSLYSETSTNEDLTENQLPKESADSEKESEINREVCQKNTIPLRSSSGSDIDVVGKEVIGKVMDRRNSNRDWNEVTVLSTTASTGSFSDIQDFSCIPCDRCSMDKMCSKTPLCSGGPVDNSTPHSVITGRNVSSGSCPHHMSFESLLLLRSKIIDTSLWQSSESSVISPGTFGTACEEASEVQNPVILPAATSVFNIAKCQMEQECGETCAATPNPPIQLTEEKAKSTEGIVLKLVEDEKDEGTGPKRMQEALDHLSDCEWYRLQKSLEEDQRAHSTLDSILEMIESAVQSKEETIKNQAPSEEALRMLQKAESGSTGNQTNTTAQKESTAGKTSGTSASITSSTGESSNKKAIERTNWTQPHRIIILK